MGRFKLFLIKWFKRGDIDNCPHLCFKCLFKHKCDIYERLHNKEWWGE